MHSHIFVKGARVNNLKNIDVDIPRDKLVVFTGLSGSGKSSLVNEIISKKLSSVLNRARVRPGRHDRFEGIENLDKAIVIDQSPIGRTPRSNPATYTGLFATSATCSPPRRTQRPAATAPAASPSTSRAAAARPAAATAL